MAIAAYTKVVQIQLASAGTTTFENIDGTNATLNLAGDVLDDTNFGSTGFRSRILGLRDWSVSISAIYGSTVAAYTTLRSAWLNRTELKMQYLPDGTLDGFAGNCFVESFNHTGDVGGLETVDVSLQASAALSTNTT